MAGVLKLLIPPVLELPEAWTSGQLIVFYEPIFTTAAVGAEVSAGFNPLYTMLFMC